VTDAPIDLAAARRKRKRAPLPNSPEALAGLRCTDLGNAERFVARYEGKVRYCHARSMWLIWSHRRWEWDTSGRISRLAHVVVMALYREAAANKDTDQRYQLTSHARNSEKASAISSMLRIAQDKEGIPVALEELDANPMQLNCQNGTINLRTGELEPHNGADLITKMCPCDFDPRARHDTWQRFLTESTDGSEELQRYIQRAAGYAVQGEASERALFFVFGPPGSAKSTLIDALGAALGDYHVSSGRETWLVQKNAGGNRGDLVRLAGSRLVTATEFRRGDRFDEGLIKAVTGGDAIVHAAKFEKEVTIRPTFALWFAANAAPIIRDDDDAMWTRMRRIPFDHVIPPERQDKGIKQSLIKDPACRAAVLAWAVAGCLLWQTEGIGSAQAVTLSNEAYRTEMDPIGGFLNDLCKFDASLRMTAGAFRKAYQGWCEDNGIRGNLDRNDIEKRLKPLGAKYATIRGKQWVIGVDMIGDFEDRADQESLDPRWR
jgi:putative DNA primase/helicase